MPCTTDENDTTGVVKYAKDTKYNDGTVATKQAGYIDYDDWTDDGANVASVSKYGGFYVGRYEAGIPSNAPFYGTAGTTYITSGRNTTQYIPVSKPNNPSWNYISQINSKIVSKAMYANSNSVKSNLIDSYAWDTIVNWMESEEEGIATNSTDYGNYLNSSMELTDALYAQHTYNYTESKLTLATQYQERDLQITARTRDGEQPWYELATGTTTETKVLNIYDMAGNMSEWTTEVGNYGAGTDATQYAVLRGGGFNFSGSLRPVSHRDGYNASSRIIVDIGFRVVLYIK